MKTREPKFHGCGIYMSMQPIKNPVKDDTCFDADRGFLLYDGEKWISNNKEYAELYDKTIKT